MKASIDISSDIYIAWELHVQKRNYSQAAENRGEFEINNKATKT